MYPIRIKASIIIAVLLMGTLCGQDGTARGDSKTSPVNLSGPRIGFTYLSDSFVDRIKDRYDMKLNPWIAQFGWQFETRFFTVRSGATAVTEWIFLVGGFEQEKFLPSLSWLIGMRSSKGFEMGMGPNLAVSGTSVVLAAGITLRSDEINFPINVAVASSKSGPRYSFLVGFNIR
jgi:hypothetical protein